MDNLERRVLLISITKLSRFDIQDWGPNRLQVQVFAHELSQRPEHEIWGVLDNEKLVAVAVCHLGPPVALKMIVAIPGRSFGRNLLHHLTCIYPGQIIAIVRDGHQPTYEREGWGRSSIHPQLMTRDVGCSR